MDSRGHGKESACWRGYKSRRSPVYGRKGMVAASQPLAVEIGLNVLRRGGNAVDAAVATAAALNVVEPCSTGLGGDCFMLFYESKTKRVHAINGSGRAPSALSLRQLREALGMKAGDAFPDSRDPRAVTVPGTAQGWEDAISRFGTWSLSDVLKPAIDLAETGFPVSPLTSHFWEQGAPLIRRANDKTGAQELLVVDECASEHLRAPRPGEIFKNPHLASVFRDLGDRGARKGFYCGRAGHAIVDALKSRGAAMELSDLQDHQSSFPEPIRTRYRGVDIFEHPPNGQGLAALLAFSVLEGIDIEGAPTSAQRLHVLIESLRLAFADARRFITDADVGATSKPAFVRALLDPAYAASRRKQIDPSRARADVREGTPLASSDTVSFQVVDGDGNAVSFVNSNYMGFGTGIIPKGTGFTLQNRGANFSLDHEHPNCYRPGKRPYHTIIPGMALFPNGELFCSFTNMGGFMQPQGHVQVISNMLDHGMDPQAAVDAPRFCITDGTSGGTIEFETGISSKTIATLKRMGHNVVDEPIKGHARSVFGRAQIIVRDRKTGVLCGGSDSRADGCAMGLTL